MWEYRSLPPLSVPFLLRLCPLPPDVCFRVFLISFSSRTVGLNFSHRTSLSVTGLPPPSAFSLLFSSPRSPLFSRLILTFTKSTGGSATRHIPHEQFPFSASEPSPQKASSLSLSLPATLLVRKPLFGPPFCHASHKLFLSPLFSIITTLNTRISPLPFWLLPYLVLFSAPQDVSVSPPLWPPFRITSSAPSSLRTGRSFFFFSS